ncbi:MAG: hypothetical protein IKB70_06510 [Bacilli bacterium]|nr:hypothetical protein [Bacilli bacterium]
MNKLHFKTTTKRIKDLMLSPDFNEMKVTEFYPGIFTLVFPNDVKIVVDLAPGHLGYASPHELFYSDKDGYGWTSEKMKITWQFAFAVWNKFSLDNRVLGEYDNSVKHCLNYWARLIQSGYAIALWDNKKILSV